MSAIKRILVITALSTIVAGCITPPNIPLPDQKPVAKKLTQQPRVVLVLGGGGARGYAHLGVLQEFEKAGIPIDVVVGASAGGIVGALYADTGSVDKAITTMRNRGFFDFADIKISTSLTAPITGNKVKWFLLRHMHARQFAELKIPLAVMATDLRTGRPYVIDAGPIAPAVLASAALPGAVLPVNMYGHTLIDGSMVEPVPVSIAKRYHPKVIIAVDISNNLDKEMPHSIYGIYYRAYQISWNKLAADSAVGADIVLHPDVGLGGTFSLSSQDKYFEDGRKAAQLAMPKIKALLAARHIG